ncbi:hypothetical protein D3C71_1698900 [compost metagenome]
MYIGQPPVIQFPGAQGVEAPPLFGVWEVARPVVYPVEVYVSQQVEVGRVQRLRHPRLATTHKHVGPDAGQDGVRIFDQQAVRRPQRRRA